MSSPRTEPPYYILLSHYSLVNSTPGAPKSVSLAHPIIQYQYADESPLPLLPHSPDEYVLVLDYDPTATNPPTAKSISEHLAVTGVKVAEAPGAIAAEDEVRRNDRMYILETTATREDKAGMEASQGENQTPESTLARFKQRNAILRRALEYPGISRVEPPPSTIASPTSLPYSPSQV